MGVNDLLWDSHPERVAPLCQLAGCRHGVLHVLLLGMNAFRAGALGDVYTLSSKRKGGSQLAMSHQAYAPRRDGAERPRHKGDDGETQGLDTCRGKAYKIN